MTNDMLVYANAGVDADVSMKLYLREPDDNWISILFGDERVSLEFYDVESLERLRDLADEGARQLRAAIELYERARRAG